MILRLFFVYGLIKCLNLAWTNIKTKNICKLSAHCEIYDVSSIVENLNFAEKLKLYLICNGWCWNVTCGRQSNRYQSSNVHQTDVLVIRMKFYATNHIIWMIGIILRNLIENWIWQSKSKSTIKIFNGSIWKILL